MDRYDAVLAYLEEAYKPEAILVYGSFADGSANEYSDFDALVIAEQRRKHDASVICDTVLDVWVYPPDVFQGDYDIEDFLQVFDGKIVLDQKGSANRLKARVVEYINQLPRKTGEELRQQVAWCKKMLLRTRREDAEGLFRRHWLLTDSLEIYFDLKQLRYFGPKKALRHMQQEDAAGFQYYLAALKEGTESSLAEWISYLDRLLQ